MSIEYKSGFIEELNRKSEAIEEFIEKIEKNKSKLEESLKNTKYADNVEEEIDKIIAKLKGMVSVNDTLGVCSNSLIDVAKEKIKSL